MGRAHAAFHPVIWSAVLAHMSHHACLRPLPLPLPFPFPFPFPPTSLYVARYGPPFTAF